MSVLPDGSQLQGVMLPRYDENHRLVGVLKAKAMTLVNDETIVGPHHYHRVFQSGRQSARPGGSHQCGVQPSQGHARAPREPVTLQSDRINAKGTGLCYAFDQGEGFLLGPVTTWIQNPTATTMNSTRFPLRATASLGMSLLALPLTAMPPPAVTPKELAAIHADVASTTTAAGQSALLARADLAQDTSAAAVANHAASAFIAQTGMPFADADTPAKEAKPLEVKPGPDDTVITCDGGMYFDADEGVFVYLKNVHVSDPRFDLSGANKLKIFLSKKPAKAADKTTKPADPSSAKAAAPPPPSAKKPTLGSGLGANSGRLTASSPTVRCGSCRNNPNPARNRSKPAARFSPTIPRPARSFSSGGYPWVKQGATFMRAEQPDLNLRILKTGSFVTEGKWDMGGNLQKKP